MEHGEKYWKKRIIEALAKSDEAAVVTNTLKATEGTGSPIPRPTDVGINTLNYCVSKCWKSQSQWLKHYVGVEVGKFLDH